MAIVSFGPIQERPAENELRRRLDLHERAAKEARAALLGCREVLGPIPNLREAKAFANIQHAIDLLDVAMSPVVKSSLGRVWSVQMVPVVLDSEVEASNGAKQPVEVDGSAMMIFMGVDLGAPCGSKSVTHVIDKSRFTDRARLVFQLANQEAQRFNHEYVGCEHLLLALVKEGNGIAAFVLKELGVDLRGIRMAMEKHLKPGPIMVTMGKLPQTARCKRVVELAHEESRGMGGNYVGTEHLLLALAREGESVATAILKDEFGITPVAIREAVLRVLGREEKLAEAAAMQQHTPPDCTTREDLVGLVELEPDETLEDNLACLNNPLQSPCVVSWRRVSASANFYKYAVKWKTPLAQRWPRLVWCRFAKATPKPAMRYLPFCGPSLTPTAWSWVCLPGKSSRNPLRLWSNPRVKRPGATALPSYEIYRPGAAVPPLRNRRGNLDCGRW